MLKDLEIESDRQAPVIPVAEVVEADEEDLRARADLCRLLSGVFVEEPDREFLGALRSAESLAGLAEAGLHFDADFLETETPLLLHELSVEFTTLFAASGGFPPVESVRLTGRYQQEPYYAVKETYRRAGFALRKGRFFVFEDQLGVELTFIAELLDRCAAALAADDAAEYRRQERELKRFWTVHLGKWVRGYARLIERAAEHSFYREMAKLLAEFAESEIAALRLRIEDQLGLELCFVAVLLDRCAAALAAGEAAECKRQERELKRFWTVHLGKWVRGYARLIERAAEHSFYREMARLLGGFAEGEIAALRLRIDDQDRSRPVVPKSEIKVEFNPDEPECNACPGARA